MSNSQQAGTRWSRQWVWLGILVAIAAFALGYGITRVLNDDGSSGTPAGPPPGISFAQAHQVPLQISLADFERRIPIPAVQVRTRQTHPPQTCRYYRLTDSPNRYVFCFARGKLVVAYSGPNI